MNALKVALIAILVLMLQTVFSSSDSMAQTRQNPHGTDFSLDCQQCHSVETWKVNLSQITFDHSKTAFPLEGQHQTVSCRGCHSTLKFTEAPTECVSCHQDIHSDQFGNSCNRCHTPASWADNTRMRQMHQETRFPLIGVHAAFDCQVCHPGGEYVNLPITCEGCHLETFVATQHPSHVNVGFGTNCQDCHSVLTMGWTGARFQHTANFPLQGGHAIPDCGVCHGSSLAALSSVCYSCHERDFNSTTDPNHVQSGFAHDCTICHSINGWSPVTFDHSATGFPLTGAHLTTACTACHVNNQYSGLSTDCFGCHESNYNATTDPNHVLGDYPHDCTMCHTTSAWSPSTFDHSLTGFPLTGSHLSASCTDCHINNQYVGTPTACFACHEDAYNGVTDPNHLLGNFSHECQTCHTTVAWSPSTFDHNQTNFPLTGAHIEANCSQCHINNQYAGTPTDCFSCHEANYNAATDPNHLTNQFPHDCAMCHSTTAWSPSTFNHNNTNFPLTGAHQTIACTACHINGQYTGTPTDCFSCHEANYNAATDPNHLTNQFPHDCAMCHSTTAWSPSTFNHNNTNFPLTGAHQTIACTECHINGQYAGTPTDCFSCHEANYNAATDPNHLTNQFPHDCAMCHSTTAWSPSTFNHNNTNFPLTGAHQTIACTECHINGQYAGTPTDCFSCHEANYNAATDPNHLTNQFPHDCAMCHSTTAWSPSTFNHNNTNFPLTGAHQTVPCNLCHINGQYSGTPTECFFCHQNDYNGATNPNHLSQGYPTDCLMCHTTNNWLSNFNHDQQYFPIYSGHHAGTWNTCADCHPNAANFHEFTCIDCHAHNEAQMNEEHQEVPGYIYASWACLQCHPTGGGGGLDINKKTSPYRRPGH